jgi:hypothetical protein
MRNFANYSILPFDICNIQTQRQCLIPTTQTSKTQNTELATRHTGQVMVGGLHPQGLRSAVALPILQPESSIGSPNAVTSNAMNFASKH